MKYLLIIGDGMADFDLDQLGGRTPLAHLSPPGMAVLAGGELGRARTCPHGLPPGSDIAFLSIFGSDPSLVYTGRSPLEAAGSGVMLSPGEVSFRVNLAGVFGGDFDSAVMGSHNGFGVSGKDAHALMEALFRDEAFCAAQRALSMRFTLSFSFRHIGVLPGDGTPFVTTPPHDIVGQPISGYLPKGQKCGELIALMRRAHEVLSAHPINIARAQRGESPANIIWPWGAGTACLLPSFSQTFGRTGAVISAVPLVKGIARLCGLSAPEVTGATGLLDTNYQGKLSAALSALFEENLDFACIHLEAPDELSHDGDLEGKLEAIRRLDSRVILPLLDELSRRGEAYRIMLMPDHYTLLSTRTHDGTPVPYCVYDSRRPGVPRPFTEEEAALHPVVEQGHKVLFRLFEE